MKIYQWQLTEHELKKIIELTGEASAALDDDVAGTVHENAVHLRDEIGPILES